MANLFDLASSMDALAGELDERANELAIVAAVAVLHELLIYTPVDTSEALSNWQVTIGAPPPGAIGPYFPGEKGSTRKQSSDAAFAEAKRTLAQKKPGQPIFVSNLAPYIVELNQGSSRQAPAGFVERSVLAAEDAVINYKSTK